MNYRAEIDGLRALAVIPVILFHAGFSMFSGGYVGVDIFFVISGYLITSLILIELESNNFKLIDFYERRARRLLPALFFVVLISLPFGWFLLKPSELINFGESIISISIFSSNILFWLETGYFDNSSELKPLLHTWSLAVEEQFYIFFPIVFLILYSLKKAWLITILFIIFILSFIISNIATLGSSHPKVISGAFFLLPFRVWELGLGVIAALYFSKITFKNRYLNEILSFSGFLMILYSIFFYDKNTPFPSFYTLMPTIGTVLIIITTSQKSILKNILSFSPIVGLGLISYSIYLWHQPVLAFSRQLSNVELSSTESIIALLISIIVGFLSWKFIEQPFRNKKKFSRKKVFNYSFAAMIISISVGVGMISFKNYSPNQLPNISYSSLGERIDAEGTVCKLERTNNYEFCFFGNTSSDYSILIHGDSHADAISYELDRTFKKKKIKGIFLRNIFSNGYQCSSTIFTSTNKLHLKELLDCPKEFKIAIESFENINAFIVLSRWTMKYYPVKNHINSYLFSNISLTCEEDFIERENYDINNPSKSNDPDIKRLSIYRYLDLFPKDKKTFLVYPIPETACDVYKLNLRNFKTTNSLIKNLYFNKDEYYDRNKFVIDSFDNFTAIQENMNIVPIDSGKIFCDSFIELNCSIINDYDPLYIDDDHLSDKGASLVIEEIFEHLQ